MRKLVYILTIAALWWPSTAAAQRHGHHAPKHHAHALQHHRARAAWVEPNGCEYAENPTWAEWRAEMAEVGFSRQEIEEFEFC